MGSSRIERAVALVALGACSRPVAFEAITAEVSDDVATVVTVRWETSEPVRSRVRFGLDGATDRVTPETPEGTSHEALLLGLPADAAVTYTVTAGEDTSEAAVVHTGALPSDLPAVEAEGTPGEAFVLATATGDVNWVLLLDPEGRVVWYHRDERGLSVFRARIARDGAGIVYTSVIEAGLASADSTVVRVPWTGGAEDAIAVPDLAHDFVELPDGTVVSLGFVVQDGVEGNDLVAIARDATTAQLWRTFDCFDPIANPGDDPAHGWTHANALDRDEATGDYFVGLRNLGTIARVDADSGACPWGFGGTGGTIALTGARFIHQHQFAIGDGRVLVFDNDGAPGNASRVIEYAFDEAAETATETAIFEADPPLYSFILGDVQREASGETLVVWSSPQTIDRYDAAGARVWRAAVGGDGPLGFVSRHATPYDSALADVAR